MKKKTFQVDESKQGQGQDVSTKPMRVTVLNPLEVIDKVPQSNMTGYYRRLMKRATWERLGGVYTGYDETTNQTITVKSGKIELSEGRS